MRGVEAVFTGWQHFAPAFFCGDEEFHGKSGGTIE
jgi:hypothetical protein